MVASRFSQCAVEVGHPFCFLSSYSTIDLTRNADKANVALRYVTRSSGSHDLDLKLWEKTLLEVDSGCLWALLNERSLGMTGMLSRRFPLEQSG